MNKSKFRRRSRLFKSRTFRCAIFWLTGTVGLLLFLTLTAEEVGALKLVDSKVDRWYRMETDWGVLKTWPDKFQHIFFPYLLQEINQRTIASERLFWMMNIGGVLKEFDDREGVSWRDILCNTLGFWGAKYRTGKFVLVPTFSVQKQSWKITASLAI